LEPRPETPVAIGKPVQFVRVPDDGVPRAGVTSVGELANTSAPEPVSSDTAEARLAEDGVAKKVATPEPNPDTPVEIGSPVAFVRVAEEGVPSAGVTSVGELAKTKAPDPVSSVTAAAKLDEDGVARKVATPVPRPETPVEIGSPVAFVSVAADGVPRFGVVSVGLLDITTSPVPVIALLTSALLPSVKTALDAVKLFRVTAPVTPSVLLRVAPEEAERVVKDPAAAVLPPIVVPSMLPESISTLEILTSPVPLGVISIFPFVSVEVIALPLIFILSTVKTLGLVPTSWTVPLESLTNNLRSAVLTASSAPPLELVKEPAEGTADAVSDFLVRIVATMSP
jgi:hypothetical protein